MSPSRQFSLLRLAVSPGIPSAELARLLVLHGEEEPNTPIQLHEVPCDAVANGLDEGRYDIGLTWRNFGEERSLRATPLWQEELALALPARSPLLVHPTVSLQELKCYEVMQWCLIAEHSLEAQLAVHALNHERVGSFELLATLVAAGYAVGIAPRSRIIRSRGWGIVMRPFANGCYLIATHLVHQKNTSPIVDRFVMRAMRLSQHRSSTVQMPDHVSFP